MIMLIPSNLISFHPLILSLMLTFYIIIMSLLMNLINSNYWYSYILFLIMIGGLMILFMYFTSIASNNLINFNINFMKYFFLKLILFMIFFLIMVFFNSKFIYYSNFLEILNIFDKNFYLVDLMAKNLYMDFSMDLNMFMLTYLFMTMVSCVLLCTKVMLPFRQLNYV
uniref:NADH dehydrogenase subunit 6 n=1 Tax=Aphidius colemani TaxID=78482 RepID=UPI0022DCE3EA|nr:NADH dehydrogenase subunit 6 [Aphidius colemani]UZT28763.1 NADH dehydrogenase subunit 6 [Aphidius colemani]